MGRSSRSSTPRKRAFCAPGKFARSTPATKHTTTEERCRYPASPDEKATEPRVSTENSAPAPRAGAGRHDQPEERAGPRGEA